jgi:hypothetical protein
MGFKNFSMWRGRLPHWRADEVTYYVTFRHSRPLDEAERWLLYQSLVKPDGKQLDLVILVVLPEKTDLLFTVREAPNGLPFELSEVIEKAKTKTGKKIIKKSGERFPPFYGESYDRIIRDDAELEERFNEILDSPVDLELCEDVSDYATLFVVNAPE